MDITILYKIFFFIFGSLIGSFSNVVAYRLPLEKSIIPRSQCEKCGKLVKWYENLPILSYLLLRGKCSSCSTRISVIHPILELLSGAWAVWLMPEQLSQTNLIYFLFYFVVFQCLIIHFVIDLKYKILPDSINIVLYIIFLCFSVYNYAWNHWLWGFGIGFGVTYFVTWLFYKLRGQVGLGGGDIKLFGALGIYLGPLGILMNIFLSCLLGSLIGVLLIASKKMDRNTPIPFGPFIIITAFIQFYFPIPFSEFTKLLFGF